MSNLAFILRSFFGIFTFILDLIGSIIGNPYPQYEEEDKSDPYRNWKSKNGYVPLRDMSKKYLKNCLAFLDMKECTFKEEDKEGYRRAIKEELKRR